jgi:serine/threonine-protein kinase
MAEIYLATSRGPEGFEKEVVIKRVRSFLASDPGFVQMFIAEARLASRLNHANLVQIFDFDKHEDTYYLAMEYVRGHSLWDVRKKSREQMLSMRPALVAQVGAEVARGLHHAHRLTDKGKPLNLVHRDVTPHNVLLSYDGAVKLTDFGVAKAGNSQTSAGVLKGKFAYMSPEQSRGEPVDARTDVFALGIVLWEMLTGGRLFDGDSDVAVLRAVQQSAIAPPVRLNPDVPPELDAIVMRALSPRPEDRYQDARELQMDLEEYLIARRWVATSFQLSELMDILFSDKPKQAAPGEVPEVTAPVEAYQAPAESPPPRDPDATYIFQAAELEAQAAAEALANAPEVFPESGPEVRFSLKRRQHRIEVRKLTGPQRWARRRRQSTDLQTTALERRVGRASSSSPAVEQARAIGGQAWARSRKLSAQAWKVGKPLALRALGLLRTGMLKLWGWSQARLAAARARGAEPRAFRA